MNNVIEVASCDTSPYFKNRKALTLNACVHVNSFLSLFLFFHFAQTNLKLSHGLFAVRMKETGCVCGGGVGGGALEIPHLAKLAGHGERASGFTASDANDITAHSDKAWGNGS